MRIHDHGWWHRLRFRIAYWLMPPCARKSISEATRYYTVAMLAHDQLLCPIHVADQAKAALADMGIEVQEMDR